MPRRLRLAYLALYCTLVSHLVAFPAGGYTAPRAYAACLWAFYALFLLLDCLGEAGVVPVDAILCGSAWPCPEAARRSVGTSTYLMFHHSR